VGIVRPADLVPGPAIAVRGPAPVPEPAVAVPRPVSVPGPAASRLDWLDVLRGIAALAVVYHHAGLWVLTRAHDAVERWFDAGVFGTTLFFLISGYLIPASLERKGSLRTFWVSRVFRLYPLWIAALVVVALIRLTGHWHGGGADRYAVRHPATFVLAHATMFQDLLAVPNAVGVMWTLSYEMFFYCLVAGLFVVRLHRFTGRIAVLFAVTGTLLWQRLPYGWLSGRLGTGPVVAGFALLFGAGLLAVVSGDRRWSRLGASVLAVGALVLFVGDRGYPWDGLLIPAYMFVGTTVHRAQHGRIRARTAWAVALCVFGLATLTGLRHAATLLSPGEILVERRHWAGAVVLAGLLFAIGLALQGRGMPRLLTRLGRISFSIYLLHLILLQAATKQLAPFGDRYSPQHHGRPLWQQVAAMVGVLVVVCVLAELTYRLVEEPMQRLGRRCAGRLDRALRPDAGLFGPVPADHERHSAQPARCIAPA
jgi:peptidoglycan/LPS O-acetylase OafA/YrhL